MNKRFISKKNFFNNLGFSLIEILVAVSIFSIVIMASTNIFSMVIEGQRNSVAAQNIQENMRYVFETISKEVRMAKISNKDCEPTGIYKVFNTSGSGSVLHFKNKDGNCVAYYLYNYRMMVDRGAASTYITPNEIKVSNLRFNIKDDLIGSFHSLEPMVTITLDIEAIAKAAHKQNMKLQLTISARYYE